MPRSEWPCQLFPPYPSDHPIIVNKIRNGTAPEPSSVNTLQAPNPAATPRQALPTDIQEALQHTSSVLDTALGPHGDGIGSNSWTISGQFPATGMPLLTNNDPHLAIQMRSIGYQIDLHYTPRNDQRPNEVAGFSFAGVLGVIIGYNDSIV